MTPLNFIKSTYLHANAISRQFGIPPIVTMAQAALESGWGVRAPGYNYFGYTAPSGYKGNRQLLKTFEYHNSPNIKYPVIISITKVSDNQYKYIVKRWFKVYANPTYSFYDYASLIRNAERYATAFNYKNDPEKFFGEIFKAGYATSPSYYTLVINIMSMIKKYLA